MGTQYWWFYDVIVVAVALICIFIGSKKGVMKSIFGFVGLILAAIVALVVSDAISDTLSGKMVCESNAKKIAANFESDSFTTMYADYLEGLDYSLRIDVDKLGKAFDSVDDIDEAIVKYISNINGYAPDEKEVLLEKVREGYAVVISDIVERSLNKYAAETAAALLKNDSSGMKELIPLIRDSERVMPSAMYISENYVSPAYNVIGRLVSYLAVFIFAGLIFVFCINSFLGRSNTDVTSAVSHVMGGVFGIFSAVVVVFAIAAAVRLSAVLGNDEMLFFNNKVVENSYAFKYFYDFAMKL